MKVCEKCETEIQTKDGENKCQACRTKAKRKAKAKRDLNREVMEIMGLTRVKGALGGVYYE